MHDLAAELRPQMPDLDDALFHQNTPTSENITANMASTMITMVIAATTELVVPIARLSVLGRMRSPKWHAISAIRMPNTTPLPRPSHRFATRTAAGSLE